MLTRSKFAAVALLAAVFVAGGAAGWGAREGGDRCENRGRRGPDAMVDHLGRELSLSPAQRDSVRAIFERHHPEVEALWTQIRPRFDSIKARVRAEVAAQLTPDQQTRYQRLLEEAEHRRRGDSTKAKADGGRD
ncbi:MAG TPA: periplasmic heavy metal sensor [Gemmatimonadales bacterium]|jgi:Spy/CpxP family protein refolding chaperone|nr:periplasmic heavy metal sensor [Gemmatimonadales bacterium]